MFQIEREIDFCYGHRILNHAGKCGHLHGHNARVIVSLQSESLNELGMVFDFADVKSILMPWIDENLDHRMILHREDPFVPVLQELREPLFLLDDNPTAESIAKLIFDFSVEREMPVTEVRLWETPSCVAIYNGAKK